ncbi:REP element-mobilizing transposase RayT [Mucilaginibacter pineti]|uniref:REP element-mobilizing transposase RayT n=1 Tax=Mucilaginibacter pineti TaxID=1391627 RepID=A0A1G7KFN2_9SPHI|nr:transposase [Mucilaginibacter pineti]SDF35965.1 REP element-mobilizing transposase RayT [Mucilaginibacter pineti]
MSDQYRVRNLEEIYFVTFTIVDWIDVFTRPVYKQLIIDSLAYCQQQKGLEIYAYCLMSNHLHLLVSARHPNKLTDIIRDFKKHTNKQLIKLITDEDESRKEWMIFRFQYHATYNSRIQDYKVWQDGYHGIACDTIQILSQKLDYIHNNPVRAGIVASPEHYLYSSAATYAGEKGLIDIILIDTGFGVV